MHTKILYYEYIFKVLDYNLNCNAIWFYNLIYKVNIFLNVLNFQHCHCNYVIINILKYTILNVQIETTIC